jgi:hypothetical protein
MIFCSYFQFFCSVFLQALHDPEFSSYMELSTILNCSALSEILWRQEISIQEETKSELRVAISMLTDFGNSENSAAIPSFQRAKLLPLLHILAFQLKLFGDASSEELKRHVQV